jgi:catechol 2,3-dioxygenase-like lactoylglutathione lyase family enzyme
MNVMSVSAVTITSNDPERLAGFYRRCLGVPLQLSSHGPMKHHFEGWLGEPERGGVHVAVLKGRAGNADAGGPAPTFRVRDIDACVRDLAAEGLAPVHRIADLGEGKRLVAFRDPDGNVFNLIDLGF